MAQNDFDLNVSKIVSDVFCRQFWSSFEAFPSDIFGTIHCSFALNRLMHRVEDCQTAPISAIF